MKIQVQVKEILFVFVMSLLIGSFFAVRAQTSTHEDHVQVVSDAYWVFLNRAPDHDGLIFWVHEMDIRDKDEAGITSAFVNSQEYSQPKPTAAYRFNYAKTTSFADARKARPTELIKVTGQFAGNDLEGSNWNVATGFYGNYIKVVTNGRTYSLWFDFSVKLIGETNQLLLAMSNPKSITVTYDPIAGIATNIQVNF